VYEYARSCAGHAEMAAESRFLWFRQRHPDAFLVGVALPDVLHQCEHLSGVAAMRIDLLADAGVGDGSFVYAHGCVFACGTGQTIMV